MNESAAGATGQASGGVSHETSFATVIAMVKTRLREAAATLKRMRL